MIDMCILAMEYIEYHSLCCCCNNCDFKGNGEKDKSMKKKRTADEPTTTKMDKIIQYFIDFIAEAKSILYIDWWQWHQLSLDVWGGNRKVESIAKRVNFEEWRGKSRLLKFFRKTLCILHITMCVLWWTVRWEKKKQFHSGINSEWCIAWLVFFAISHGSNQQPNDL